MLYKKGGLFEKPIWFVIDLVIAIVVFFLALQFVDNRLDSTTFEKIYLAKDLGLVVDALYVPPGSLVLQYPENSFWFSYLFEDNKIEVFEEGFLSARGRSFFISDGNVEFEETSLIPQKRIEKRQEFIEKYLTPLTWFGAPSVNIPKESRVSISFLRTPQLLQPTSASITLPPKTVACDGESGGRPLRGVSFLFDQVEGVDPRGSASMAYHTFTFLQSSVQSVLHTRTGNIASLSGLRKSESEIEELRKQSDVYVGFEVGEYDHTKKIFKALYPGRGSLQVQEASRQLACLIVRAVLKRQRSEFDAASLAASNSFDFPAEKVGVRLVIGNKHGQEGQFKDPSFLNTLGASITEGVGEFYS